MTTTRTITRTLNYYLYQGGTGVVGLYELFLVPAGYQPAMTPVRVQLFDFCGFGWVNDKIEHLPAEVVFHQRKYSALDTLIVRKREQAQQVQERIPYKVVVSFEVY